MEDGDGAEKELKGLLDLLNRTWKHRAEITPDHTTRQHPTPIAVYKLLSNTNCKQCREPTCFSFALKLAVSQKKLADCPPLTEPKYADKLVGLEAIIIEAPAIG